MYFQTKIIKVLLVEVEPIVQNIHKVMLEILCCKVDLAVDAEEAFSPSKK